MSDTAATLRRQMFGSAGLLALFAIVGGVLVAGTEALTRERIIEQQRASLRSTLTEVLPAERYTNALLDDTIRIRDPDLLGTDEPLTAYRARRGAEPVAVLFPVVAPDGYSGDIRLLVGIDTHGTLTGVRVLNHRETPGLGDAIETRRSDWIRQFAGLSLGEPPPRQWKVRKDGGQFDQFAGATITPRAVIKAVRQALVFFDTHRDTLLAPPVDTP
ncbi:MAG: electron transport complex subunit RsxG [Abyssibacter sp.]|uniref:electron transport complex subunit RsxG n=1 Tax=Abyssibacter sp. TaxID=2320200 RepID=UPI003219A8FC